LFSTAQPTKAGRDGAEISVQQDGTVGIGMYTAGKLLPNRWHNVAISVNTIQGNMRIAIDGQEVSVLTADMGLMELLPDGPLSIRLDQGLCIFASNQDSSMLGGDLSSVTIFNRSLTGGELEGIQALFRLETMWSCLQCSYKNQNHSRVCEICGEARVVLPGPVPAGTKPPPPLPPVNPLMAWLRDELGLDISQEELDEAISQVGEDQIAISDYIFNKRRF